MKRTQVNAGLLAVGLALAALVWLGQKQEETKRPLTSLEASKVTSITIEHPNAPPIRLTKQDDVWLMTAPVKAEVDPFEVNALVGLANTGVQAYVKDAKLKELGLEPPAYSITLNDRRIDVGGEEPLKYRRYVRVGKDKPVLVNDLSSAAFDKDYSDLVAKSLLPTGADITRIASPELSMEKTAGGTWTSPDHPQAKPEALAAIAAAWKDARSMWNAAIVADDLKAPAVTLTLADGRTLGFTIASRNPQLLLASPALGVRYALAPTDVDRLLKLAPPTPPNPPPTSAVDQPLPASPSPQPTTTPPAESATP